MLFVCLLRIVRMQAPILVGGAILTEVQAVLTELSELFTDKKVDLGRKCLMER